MISSVKCSSLDAPKNPENGGKSLLTYYDTVCLNKNTHVSAMFWLEAKLVVCCGHKWRDARNKVMFKQVGDDDCKRNRSAFPASVMSPQIGTMTVLHAFLWNFSMH